MAVVIRGPVEAGNHLRPDPTSRFELPNLLTTTLFVAAAILPFQNAQAFPGAPQYPRSVQVDVPSNIVLNPPPVLAAPSFNPPTWSPPKFQWQPEDASASTPKTLYADLTLPTFNASQFLVDRLRPVTDTTQSSPIELLTFVVVPLPPGTANWVATLDYRAQFRLGLPSAVDYSLLLPTAVIVKYTVFILSE